MKRIQPKSRLLLTLILLYLYQSSFSQEYDNIQQIDLCARLKSVKVVSVPFYMDDFEKFDTITKYPSLLSAIKKATQIRFSEGECVSGENDEELFASDFDTLDNPVYQIIRIAPPKDVINNSWVFLINTHDNHTWLITFGHKDNDTNCMIAKNAVLIQFNMGGNKHWYHNRSGEFKTPTTINMSGSCWQEMDDPKKTYAIAKTLVIQKDGRITVLQPKKKK